MGIVYIKAKKYTLAEDYLLKSLSISKDIGVMELLRNQNGNLARLYEETRQFEKAYQCQKEFNRLNVILFNDEKSKDIGKLEARHEMEVAEQERIKAAQEEARIKTASIRRRNTLQYSGIVFLLLIVAIVVVLLGIVRVNDNVARGVTFFTFLILFEFMIVLLDPTVEKISNGEPAIKLFFNALIAVCIFPIHGFFEKKLIRRLTRKNEPSTKKNW